jgi:hypothetical protein
MGLYLHKECPPHVIAMRKDVATSSRLIYRRRGCRAIARNDIKDSKNKYY